MDEDEKSKPEKQPRKESFREKVLRFMNYFFVLSALITISVLAYFEARWWFWIVVLGLPGLVYLRLRYHHREVDTNMGEEILPPGGNL